MRKLTATTLLSLDGVMQGPGGADEDRDGGFDLGGWVVPHVDEDMGRFVNEWFERAGAFLLGRRTYEIFAAYWPHVADPDDLVAAKLNSLPKYVASRTLDKAEWESTTLLKEDIVEAVSKLKQGSGGEIQVHGSGGLLQTLMAHGLVDEYRLWFYPVVLGRGKRLFPEGIAPTALKLLDTKTTSTGIAVHTYRFEGRPKFGEIPLNQS